MTFSVPIATGGTVARPVAKNNRDKILRLMVLAGKPVSTAQIVKATGMNTHTVQMYLRKLRVGGNITIPKRGLWQATSRWWMLNYSPGEALDKEMTLNAAIAEAGAKEKEKGPSSAQERQEEISQILKGGPMLLREIAANFPEFSPHTIGNDLAAMKKRGRVKACKAGSKSTWGLT